MTANEPKEAVTDVQLAKTAERAAEAGDKSLSLIARMTAQLQDPELRKKVRQFNLPPKYSEIVNDGCIADVLPEIQEIVEYYRTGEAVPGQIDADTLKLGALLFYFAGKANHLETLAISAEGAYDQGYERTLLEARSIADLNKEKVTKEILEALAATETEDLRGEYVILKMLAHVMKGFYFAAKDLLEVMNSVGIRLYKSNLDTTRGN